MKFKLTLTNSLLIGKDAEVEIVDTHKAIKEGERELGEGKTKIVKTLADFSTKTR